LGASELRLELRNPSDAAATVRVPLAAPGSAEVRLAAHSSQASAFAFDKIFEARLPLAGLGLHAGQSVRLQVSVWTDGLPVDSAPTQGWLEFSTAEPSEWPV
jgi:hypothetical protein